MTSFKRNSIKFAILILLVNLISFVALSLFSPAAGYRRLLAEFDNTVNYGKARGLSLRTHVSTEGSLHKYSLFVPHNLKPDSSPAAILFLHGVGKRGMDGVHPLADGIAPQLWESRGEFPFIVVWPQCPKSESWRPEKRATQIALDILTEVQDEFRVDPKRVYLSGISDGGHGTWAIAADNPGKFSAIIPISSNGVSNEVVQKVSESGTAVWNLHVAQDETSLVECNHKIKRKLFKLGRSPRFTEIQINGNPEIASKHDAWSFAYANPAVLNWLNAQSFADKPTPSTEFHLCEFQNGRTAPKSASTNVSVETNECATTLSACDTGGVTSSLPMGVEGECHIEFFPDSSTQRCGLAFLTESSGTSQGYAVEVASTLNNTSGGLFSYPKHVQLTQSSPVSEQAFIPNQWNDLRVKWNKTKVQANLNGWPLLDTPIPDDAPPNALISLTLTGAPASTVQWRDMRIRKPGAIVVSKPLELKPLGTLKSRASKSDRVTTMTEIRDAWNLRQHQLNGAELKWEKDAESPTGWTPFRAAIGTLVDNSYIKDTITFDEDLVTHTGPWMYDHTQISRRRGVVGIVRQTDLTQFCSSCFKPSTLQFKSPFTINNLRTPMRRISYASDASNRHALIRGTEYRITDCRNERVGLMEELYTSAPLLALLPAATHGAAINLDQCTVTKPEHWIDGRRTVLIKETSPSTNQSGQKEIIRKHWLDPDRAFTVLRSRTYVANQLREQTDIRYAPDSTCGWRPTGWTVFSHPPPAKSTSRERFFPGNELLFHHASATVADWSFRTTERERSPAAHFPIGTAFFDQNQQRWLSQTTADSTSPLDKEVVTLLASGTEFPSSTSMLQDARILSGIGIALTLSVIVMRIRRNRNTRG